MKKHFLFQCLVLGVFGFSVQLAAQTVNHAANKLPPKLTSQAKKMARETHLWNLQDVEILKVIAEVSRETGKNFIVDPQVTGKITIVSSEPISSDEVYSVFLSTLQVLGYGTVETGDLIKIIPIKDAVQNGPVTKHTLPKAGDTLIVKVISLKNVSAVQLSPSLTPLVPSWANITAYAPSNSIVISGTANIVKRIEDIIHTVDTPFANGIDIIHLQYADAGEVVKSIEKLEQGHRFASGDYGSSVSADIRSNSIMLGGSDATRLHYKVLITQLDVPTTQLTQNSGTIDTQVFILKFNSITAILPVLRSSVRQSVNVNVVDSSISAGTSMSSYSSGSTSGGGGTSSAGPIAAKLPEVTNASLNGGASNTNDQSGITIVGDVPNNALIITAPPNIMRTLKAIIQQLDVRPKQVLVQGIIAEVNAEISNRLGIQWSTNETNPLIDPKTGIGSFGAGVGVGFIHQGSLSALITALSSDTNTNILATPSITVLNNGNAAITVGSSVSVVMGNVVNPSGSVGGQNNITNTFNYKDVGLSLNVIPQITFDDSVNLKISQSNSTILPKVFDPTPGANNNPNMNNQSLSTTVLVKNEDILVLGSLTQNQEQIKITKVPFLSAIPLLGKLFQYQDKTTVKKDLLIFLRPVILNTDHDARIVSHNKYDMGRNAALYGASNKELKAVSILPDRNYQELPEPFSQAV